GARLCRSRQTRSAAAVRARPLRRSAVAAADESARTPRGARAERAAAEATQLARGFLDQLDAPIVGASCDRVVRVLRLRGAVAARVQARAVDVIPGDERLRHRHGTALR